MSKPEYKFNKNLLLPQYDRLAQLHELGKKLAAALETAKVLRNCMTCANFVEPMELCEKFGQRPPAKIIAYGCDNHTDEIPF